MAKKKKQLVEPILHPGVPLPLDYPEIPNEWMPVDDFSSHRPLLYRAIMNTAHSAFIEFGMGNGSTPALRELYANSFPDRELVSFENDYQWFELMLTTDYQQQFPQTAFWRNHYINYMDNILQVNLWKGCIVFVDCAPAELRKHLISKHSSTAKLIIVHDTEPGAEYVYGLGELLNSFRFRCDLIVEGNPQTTVVSNLYNLNGWKTEINNQIKFI
jgi:hypothetical protein